MYAWRCLDYSIYTHCRGCCHSCWVSTSVKGPLLQPIVQFPAAPESRIGTRATSQCPLKPRLGGAEWDGKSRPIYNLTINGNLAIMDTQLQPNTTPEPNIVVLTRQQNLGVLGTGHCRTAALYNKNDMSARTSAMYCPSAPCKHGK